MEPSPSAWADAAHTAQCDYVGVVSGNQVPDKLEKAGFHTEKAQFVDAPVIQELPMALECRLVSYDKDSCRLVGEIVSVSAEERILGLDGKIDPGKAGADCVLTRCTTPIESWEKRRATLFRTA